MNDNTNMNENVNSPAVKSGDNSRGYLCRLVVTLAAICVAIALLLAVVNAVTADKIAENAMRSKQDAVLTIFKKGSSCELYRTFENGSEVYLVYRDGGVIGYCVFVSSVGFRGVIDMMVGINSAYETEGVKIVSMSETPGVGTKAGAPDFLDRFVGASHSDPAGGVDAISGATVSSEAVKAGVVSAHAAQIDLAAICAEKGCELITPEMLESVTVPESTEVQTESEITSDEHSTEPEVTEPVSPDTDAEETEPAETEDIPFVDKGGMKDFIYNVDATSVSDRFVIEIPKDEETATFETTTAEPETTPLETTPPETTPAVTEPPVTTAPETIVTEPPVTTVPETTEAETTEDPNEIPPWLDTQPEETIPPWLDTQPEETVPSWIGG